MGEHLGGGGTGVLWTCLAEGMRAKYSKHVVAMAILVLALIG